MNRALLAATLGALAACHPEREAQRAAVASPSPVDRAAAVRGLAEGGDVDDLGYLIPRVEDPDPLVRGAVAQGLAHFDDRRSADALAELTNDSSELVQLEAVKALGSLKVARGRSYLVLAYQRTGSKVRAQVAETLKESGGSPADAVLAEARALYAEYTRDLAGAGPSRLSAAEQLGHSGRPEAVERLSGYLAAESHPRAIAAARGVGASGAPEARPALEALLTDEDPDLQIAGAQALGALGDPAAGPALLRSLQRGGRVAAAALESLLALTEGGVAAPTASKLLCAAALSPEASIAAAAGRAVRARKLSCAPEPFLTKLRRGPEAAAALAAVAEIWAVPGQIPPRADAGADDEEGAEPSPFLRAVGDLLKGGGADARPGAARAAGALALSELLPELRRAQQEAEKELHAARERWVKDALPTLFTKGFAPGEAGVSHARVRELMGRLDALEGKPGAATPAVSEEAPGRWPSLFSPAATGAMALWAEASLGEVRLAPRDVAPLVAELRGDPDPRPRLAAVEAVQWLTADKQWEALLPLLEDRDGAVRESAVAAAGRLDPAVTEAGRWLLDQVRSAGSEPDLPMGTLVTALGGHRELSGASAALASQLERPDAAAAAVRALLALGTPEAKTALLAALNGHRGVALRELLEAAGALGDAAALPACRPLLFHIQPEVRAAAVRALRALDGPKATEEIQVLAQDYDRRVRQAVEGR